jgi:hypothetical protein
MVRGAQSVRKGIGFSALCKTGRTLGVAELERSRSFYERLGWKRSNAKAEEIVFFQAGGMALALYPRVALATGANFSPHGFGFCGITLAYNTGTRGEVDAVLAQARASCLVRQQHRLGLAARIVNVAALMLAIQNILNCNFSRLCIPICPRTWSDTAMQAKSHRSSVHQSPSRPHL